MNFFHIAIGIWYNFQKRFQSKSIDVTVPSSNWLFHAFLNFPVAFPDLEIRVADFSSFESPSVNFTFISFLNFVFLSSIWSVSLVFPVKGSSVTDNHSSDAFKLHISSSFKYGRFVYVGLFCCVSSSESESCAVCCLSCLCCCCCCCCCVSWVLSFLLCIIIEVFFLESVYRDVHVYNDYHVLLALVDYLDLKHRLDPSIICHLPFCNTLCISHLLLS